MPRFLPGKVILYLIVLLMVDVCLMPAARYGEFQPVMLYLAVLYAAFRWHRKHMVPVAFTAGLLRDLAGSQALGAETVVLVATASFFSFFIPKIERESLTMRFILTFLFVFLVLGGTSMFSGFLGSAGPGGWASLKTAFSVALITALVMPVFFFITARWFGDESSLRQYELFF